MSDQTMTVSTENPRVLLLMMPWADLRLGIGICLLKSVLASSGIAADTLFPNMALARRIGLGWYGLIGAIPGPRYSGEVYFTPYAFGLPPAEFADRTLPLYYNGLPEWVENYLGVSPPIRAWSDFPALARQVCVEYVPAFLDELVNTIPWARYDIVGFSVMFGQMLSSAALARVIKARWPNKQILFGGPSCDGGMGMQLLELFDFVDVVVSGEADLTISPLVDALRGDRNLDDIPGLAFRRNGAVVQTGAAPIVTELDVLPVPDYSDYMAELKSVGNLPPLLHFETSRGCWWGEKHHCTFCGLNCKGLHYRRKSPQRAVQEIITIADTWNVRQLRATDNIFDMRYFRDFVSTLTNENAKRPHDSRLQLFYEIKSNLKKEQIRQLAAAGICQLQPGIESFSDHVLALMNKGTSCLQHIQLLKWASENGLHLTYGVLYGVPGEEAADYEEMSDLVPFLAHLFPPTYLYPIFLERFSEYHEHPERYGIRTIEPFRRDALCFPIQGVDLSRLLYSFQFTYEGQDDPTLRDAVERCLFKLRSWRASYQPNTLTYVRCEDGVLITDTRNGGSRTMSLDGPEARLFLFLDSHRSRDELEAEVKDLPQHAMSKLLERLHNERLVYYNESKRRYLALPVESGAI